jgi:diguanylate cyclase (GGDEF)-like protein
VLITPGLSLRRFLRENFPILFAFGCLAVAISAWQMLQLKDIDDEIASQSRQDVVESSAAFATVVNNTVILVDGLLRSVRHIYEHSGPEAVNQFLDHERLSNTPIVYFATASPRGISFIFGDPVGSTVDLKDRPHFLAQQGVREDKLFIGVPNEGRLSHKTVIPLTRGLHQADGSLAGMVMAGIEPSLLSSHVFDPTKLGIHGVVAVIGLDGIIRAHGATDMGGIGTRIPDSSALWRQLKQADKGLYWQQSVVDGRKRLYAYEKLRDFPLIIVAGIAEEDMSARAQARRLPYELACAVVLGLMLVVFVLVMRQQLADVRIRHDRERLAQALDEIERHVYHDALTGLPNRLLLEDRLAHAIDTAGRNGSSLALMFIDLDDFKMINDTLGHDAGDELLKRVVERLQACLHRDDTIARLGGDEFIVIRSSVKKSSEVAAIAGRIVETLGGITAFGEVKVSASIGIALFPDDGQDVTTLMKVADSAMYQAKSAGRNTFRFFDVDTMAEAVARLQLVTDLNKAAANGEFELFFQPKVTLAGRLPVGAEALIRWRSPDRGLVFPDTFIALAEETGLIVDIGSWVLNEACRLMAAWDKAGIGLVSLAVNVSARQLADDRFVTEVGRLLADHRLSPTRLEIELTESAMMAEPERTTQQLRRLRDLGVAVTVDDFGTGYSSLSYLKRLPLTSIKIDRSFVKGVPADPDNAGIVAAVMGLARTMGLAVVAEGIESAAEEAYLRDAGCQIGQGELYARPLSAEAFAAWLEDRPAPPSSVLVTDS